MTLITYIKKLFLQPAIIMVLFAASVNAQDVELLISGRVTNNLGAPLKGIIVTSEKGKNGTFTDNNGDYSLIINDQSSFVSFSGKNYKTQKATVGGKETIDIALVWDAHYNDEVVELGYTSQLRSEVSGAVSTVTGEELLRSPVANLTQTLPGRLPGLTTIETFSELSRANTALFVRGFSMARQNGPLVVIDGIPTAYNSNQSLEYINPNEIESISLLKDASTQALYGILGANGVLVVKTRRGEKGGLQIKARVDQAVQQNTTQPGFINSSEYVKLRNQATYNDWAANPDPDKDPYSAPYTEQDIAAFAAGNNPLYPNNNWYKKYWNNTAGMQRVNVDLQGGNDWVRFYSNLNFMHQGGQFNTDQPRYETNGKYLWFNYRANVDMNINKYLRAFVRLTGNIKRERTPGGAGIADTYSSIFFMPSAFYGPLTPEKYDDHGALSDSSYQVVATQDITAPTYGLLNRSGYINHTVTNIVSQFGVDLDMGFITKGLNLSGIFAYQTNSVGSLRTLQNYEHWIRTDNKDELEFSKSGSWTNSPLAYSKGHQYYYHLTYNIALNYDRSFGNHKLGALGYMYYQDLTKADVSGNWMLPYNRVHTGAEVSYGYNNKYFLKLDLGYSGSEQYARNVRYTSTPAAAVAWLISNESFLKDSKWLSNLKLRASYGKSANDQSGLLRFAYLDNVRLSGGGPLGYLQYYIDERERGNPNIRAEVSTKGNLGLDLGLFNALSLSVDVFKEKVDNMVVSAISTIPEYQGIPLDYYPAVNQGQFENKGYEATLNYSKWINKDFKISVGGMVSYSKNTLIKVNEATRTNDYIYPKRQEGYSYGQQFGYLVDYSNGNGFFNTQQELDNNTLDYAFGTPRLGDLIYRDLNGDGLLDERDMAPIGKGAIPRTTYGITAGVNYKSFELNILFQGIGDYSTVLGGIGVWENYFHGVYNSLHKNAWTPERYQSGEAITYPALSARESVNHQPSDFFNYNRRYLRLKNVELAYNFPVSVSKLISASNIRLVLSGQNLITWDKMKSPDFGPEGTYLSIPVYKVYNVGLSVTF
ncbi:MAG: SusC/RagA family TonB-linked outer membrane protein [Chitinophagaceae bacterium]|nr:SusC/RagA family TonB-linked outer membrane protein [Chitinophagaceae bacterium]